MAFRGDIENFIHSDINVDGEVFVPDARLVGGKPGTIDRLVNLGRFSKSADHATKGDPGHGGKVIVRRGQELFVHNKDLKKSHKIQDLRVRIDD